MEKILSSSFIVAEEVPVAVPDRSMSSRGSAQDNLDILHRLDNIQHTPSFFARCFNWLRCRASPYPVSDASSIGSYTYMPMEVNHEDACVLPLSECMPISDNAIKSFRIVGNEIDWKKGSFSFAKDFTAEKAANTCNIFHCAYNRLTEYLAISATTIPLSPMASFQLSVNEDSSHIRKKGSPPPIIHFTNVNSTEKVDDLFLAIRLFMENADNDDRSMNKIVLATMMIKIQQHLILHPPAGLTADEIADISSHYLRRLSIKE